LNENPPEDTEYISENVKVGIITNKKDFFVRKFLKRFLRRLLLGSNISLTNKRKTRSRLKYDLIHCAHCLSKNNSQWVADFEGIWQLWISGKSSKRSYNEARKILEGKNCKKILAWTESAKKEFIEKFPSIKDKIEVVSYAMPFKKIKKKTKKTTLLFIGRYFYEKGGLHALETMNRLTKKYKNVEAIFVSQTPKKIRERYEKNRKIKIFDLMPYERIVKEIYPKADIVIYPGYSDSFGFSFIESLSFGIPVITVNGFARKEIIENEKTGFVIERPDNLDPENIGEKEESVIEGIISKASKLIENRRLREKMSKNCFESVKNGKFSLKVRNEKLRRIYREALL
jgi:glycosyltransferase involved in cell wall biosynthesis